MLRLAIVDDHSIVRAGFREMLEDEIGIRIEFEAASGEEALQQLREQPCDILLLDLSMPGQSGVDVLRTVCQRYSDLKVLVLSGYPEERYALPMIRHGASGYLCKDCEREELLAAIQTIAQGRRYVSRKTAELLANDLAGISSSLPHESLSDRELQVFLRLARGESVSLKGLHRPARRCVVSRRHSGSTVFTVLPAVRERLCLSNAMRRCFNERHEFVHLKGFVEKGFRTQRLAAVLHHLMAMV